MTFVYNVGTLIYGALIRFVALWNPKAQKWVEGRNDLFTRLEATIDHSKPIVWVHCASLGEFEQGRPIIDSIKADYPEFRILLTFYSPSGYEVRKDYQNADYVFYLPLDTPRNARRFVEIVAPSHVFFVKYDYWFHLLRELANKNIPTYFISAIFRKQQLFFKPWGQWYRNMLKFVTHFFVQSNESKVLLESIGVQNVTVSGDTRFDRVAQVVESARKLEWVEAFLGGEKAHIGGSTWEPDEELIAAYVQQNPEQKWIVAPHEVNEASINRLYRLFGDRLLKYSDLVEGREINGHRILLIDCYGLLTSIYQYGSLAVIGGGFGVGIHNTLEAATFGMPIVFGPNYSKFKEANDLVALQAAFSIADEDTFLEVMNTLDSDVKMRKKAGNRASHYVQQNRGAKDRILKHIF